MDACSNLGKFLSSLTALLLGYSAKYGYPRGAAEEATLSARTDKPLAQRSCSAVRTEECHLFAWVGFSIHVLGRYGTSVSFQAKMFYSSSLQHIDFCSTCRAAPAKNVSVFSSTALSELGSTLHSP